MDKITNTAQIIGVLKKIHKRRAMLSISVAGATPGSEKNYNSAILEIKSDGTRGHIIIDELTPKEGHDLLLKAGKLKARLQLDGIKISFTTTLESSGDDAGIAFYALALPVEMDYIERRAYHRVRLSLAKPLTVNLVHALIDNGETVFHGEIYDLSAGGLSIKLKSDLLITTPKPTDILTCSFTLPPKEEITCELEVRSIHATNQQNLIRIGVRFSNLPSTVQKLIQRYIITLEREQIKKMPRDA